MDNARKFRITHYPSKLGQLATRYVDSPAELVNAEAFRSFRFHPGGRIKAIPAVWLGNGDRKAYNKLCAALSPLRLGMYPNATLFAKGVLGSSEQRVVHPHEYGADEVGWVLHRQNLSTEAFTLDQQQRFLTLNPNLDCRQISEPALVLAQCGQNSYGHWLLDVLPKLVYWWSLPFNCRLVLTEPLRRWQRAFLRMLGIRPEHWLTYDPGTEYLQLNRAILASPMRNKGAVHPLANTIYERLISQSRTNSSEPDQTSPGSKLYVSRRLVNTKRSKLVNEGAVIALLIEQGFQVVEPESMTVPEQIRLFRNANLVIGEAGSALHNTVFSPRGTRVLCLLSEAWPRFGQAAVGHLRNQPTGFLFGSHNSEYDKLGNGRPFSVDLSDLKSALESLEAL